MNIFDVIFGNLRQGPLTLRFPERVAPPARFRGPVQLQPERCIGCATCAYACVSGAIQVSRDAGGYVWVYDPGRCTFCARCADVCPVQALTLSAERSPVYRQAGALRQVTRLAYPLCPECGQPAQPVTDAVLARVFDEITAEVRLWSRLCERCRRLRYQPALVENGLAARSLTHGR